MRISSLIVGIGASEGDDSATIVEKRFLVALALLVWPLAVLWGLLYMAYDEPRAASIPWAYAVSAVASLVHFGFTRNLRFFRTTQLLLILVLPFLLQLSLGGFVSASAVIIWSLLAPLGALALTGRRAALGWFGAYVVLVIGAQVIQPSLDLDNSLPSSLVAIFFVMNILGATGVAFFAMRIFVRLKDEATAQLAVEREKSERLLLNILPRSIAERLKETDETIADRYSEVSVLFADIVGFTPLSATMGPEDLVGMLNEVFEYFDSLVARYGLEKIRTVGDTYIVASGVPLLRDDHAHALARMALEMNNGMPVPKSGREPMTFRIGMSSGPAVAGIIGKSKFQYDVWGDTVNTASRMESHGVPGRIQLSASTYDLIKGDFVCEPRGVVDVKGKGPMETWFLTGAR